MASSFQDIQQADDVQFTIQHRRIDRDRNTGLGSKMNHHVHACCRLTAGIRIPDVTHDQLHAIGVRIAHGTMRCRPNEIIPCTYGQIIQNDDTFHLSTTEFRNQVSTDESTPAGNEPATTGFRSLGRTHVNSTERF